MGHGWGATMLEIMGLAVTAVAQICERQHLPHGSAVDVTWRHYSYDPDNIWFLEVEVATDGFRQRSLGLVR